MVVVVVEVVRVVVYCGREWWSLSFSLPSPPFSITLTAATAVSTTSTAPPQASTTTPSLFSSVAEAEDDHYGSLVAVTAVRGATAKLPCDVSSINPDDPVLLVLWYKNASLTPVYSFDSRRREERISTSSWTAGRGRQWADEWVWGKGRRVWFDASTSPAHLVVQPVGGRDEGNYRCKVHFRSSPSWSQKITLTVKDPPGYPRLQDPLGRRLEGPIGPYNQGTTVTLICLASGDPRPGLVWGGDALTVGKVGRIGEGGAAGIAGQSRAVLQVVASRQTSGANITCSTTATVIPSTPPDVIVIASTSPTQDMSSNPSSSTPPPPSTTTTTISLPTPLSPVLSTTTATTTTTTTITTAAASSTPANTNASTTVEAVTATAAITATTTITHTVNAILTVNLPPTSVRLRAAAGSEAWVIGGQQSTFTCRVEGAFPQPIVRWSLGRRELTTQQYPVVVEAGVLESQVVLTPEAGDHGAALTCSAHSPHLPHAALQDHITLTVHFVPVARLRATGLDGDNITVSEGDNVSLVCHLQANPSVYNVTWFHNGRAVFRGVEGARMEVRQVRPAHRGLYTCLASNQVGDGHSNAVSLNVMFRPVCAANQTLQYRRVRGEALTIVYSSPERLASVGRKEGLTGRYTLPRLKEERREEQVVQCWARNTEGTQLYPCNFTIFTQSRPGPVGGCKVTQHTAGGFTVQCQPEPRPGPHTSYTLLAFAVSTPNKGGEVNNTAGERSKTSGGKSSGGGGGGSGGGGGGGGGGGLNDVTPSFSDKQLVANLTHSSPVFTVRGLEAGLEHLVMVRAQNQEGQGEPVFLTTFTLNDNPQTVIRMPPRLDVGDSGNEGGRGKLLVALLSAVIVVAAGVGGIVAVAVMVVRWRGAARHDHHPRDTVELSEESVVVLATGGHESGAHPSPPCSRPHAHTHPGQSPNDKYWGTKPCGSRW
ncbi:hypothetical protein O3P69_016871 [Scylla paramamosain]|uniref:Ig-like domain-containing protein n=1 Tax=Scylla paramamosain TaxID=85552 RepID=A0AAW0T049_SCYPA